MKGKIMAFTSGSPYCSACVEIERLLDLVRIRHEKIEIIHYKGEEAMARLDEYGLTFVPSIVINDRIIIEGVCPSLETVEKALRRQKSES